MGQRGLVPVLRPQGSPGPSVAEPESTAFLLNSGAGFCVSVDSSHLPPAPTNARGLRVCAGLLGTELQSPSEDLGGRAGWREELGRVCQAVTETILNFLTIIITIITGDI